MQIQFKDFEFFERQQTKVNVVTIFMVVIKICRGFPRRQNHDFHTIF